MVRAGPKSRFIKVRCNKCKNEQIIFGSASKHSLLEKARPKDYGDYND